MERQATPNSPPPRPWFGRSMVIIFALLLAGAIGFSYYLARQPHISPHPETATAFAHAVPGESLTVALRVQTLDPSGVISGLLLDRSTNGSYHLTTTKVRVQQGEGAKLVLGTKRQLHPGVLIQASGVLMSDHMILATQLLILPSNIHLAA